MVKTNKTLNALLAATFSLALVGQAVANGGRADAAGGGAPAAGGGAPAASGPNFLVKVSLSSQAGVKGSLTVFEKVNGQYVSRKSCQAIGSVKTNLFDSNPANKSVKTPSGNKRVYGTSSRLRYQGNWIGMSNATYFEESHGNPIAVHTGDLGGNSHGCVRTTSDCSAYIRSKANLNSTAGSPSGAVPYSADYDVRQVSRGQMSIDVSYF